jgi:Double sensory domain of two-component sensor kinase
MAERVVRGRLITIVAGLLVVVLSTGLLVVTTSARARARNAIDEELRLAGALFVAQLDTRSRQLVAATRALGGDSALRTGAGAGDQEGVRAILAGHRRAISADVVMLLSSRGTVAADTLRPAHLGAAFPLSPILDEADRAGEASRIVVMDGGLYRLAFVPVAALAPGAWLCAGFAIDERSAADVRRRTGLQVSILRHVDSGFVVHASTLEGAQRDDLRRTLAASRMANVIELGGQAYATRTEPVGNEVLAVLQRPLAEGLRPYDRLVAVLLIAVGAGLVLALIGVFWLSPK